MMKHVLKWAEDHGNVEISLAAVESLRPHLDEDPGVLNHLLWAFLNVNLVDAAGEVFCNVPDSQGFEAWRRVNRLIFSKSEQRLDELYRLIHNPKVAGGPAEVQAVLED